MAMLVSISFTSISWYLVSGLGLGFRVEGV